MFVVFSCSEAPVKNEISSSENVSEQISYSKEQIKELKTASKVVYNLPSPSEMAVILHETKAVYDIGILNNPKALNKYYTDVSRALNLGVYFADLSFTSMFDYPQQAMLFMGAAQMLAEDLNIVGVFNEGVVDRLEQNLSNKDSILEIVSETYMETDLYLQENERPIIAKAVLAGAWLEGLYIAVNLKTDQNKKALVMEKLGQQKTALTNLINMIEDSNEPQLISLVKQFRKLELAFSEVTITQVSTADGKEQTNAPIINKVVISEKTYQNIKNQTILIRKQIISTQ